MKTDQSLSEGISVIVPVYKVEKYLRKCIESLLVQTYPTYEVILVDDGSPDNCPLICDRYAKSVPNVISLHKENGGLSSARNYGVRNAHYDLIAFVDSDDYVEKTYLEDLYELMNKFKAELVVTMVKREPEDSKIKKKKNKFSSYCVNRETALFEIYGSGKVGWQAVGKLYHQKTLLQNPFPDGYYEDCAVMYRIIDSVDRIAIGDFEGNYHYIDRQGSIVRSELKVEHLHIFDICSEFQEFICVHYPQFDVLPVVFYQKSLIQLLHLLSMSVQEYTTLYYKYQILLKKNLVKVFRDKRISNREKLHMLLFCMPVWVYRFVYNLKHSLQKH